MTFDAKEILRILPHRYPFLLVDKVLELEPGARIVGLKNVTLNEPYFVGHFPGHPIMPGVLLVEMMAQIGGVMALSIKDHAGKLAYLAGVDKTRFRRPVLPGDTVTAEVTLVKSRANVRWVRGEAKVDGRVVCDAELSFVLISRDETGL